MTCGGCGKPADVSEVDPGYARCLHCQAVMAGEIQAPDATGLQRIAEWVDGLSNNSFGGRQVKRLLMLLDRPS
jgi:hypothetical protein